MPGRAIIAQGSRYFKPYSVPFSTVRIISVMYARVESLVLQILAFCAPIGQVLLVTDEDISPASMSITLCGAMNAPFARCISFHRAPTHIRHLRQRCLASMLKTWQFNMRMDTTEHDCRQTRTRAMIIEADCAEYSAQRQVARLCWPTPMDATTSQQPAILHANCALR